MTRQSSDGSITGPLHLPYVTSSYIKDLSHFNLKIKTNPTENKKEWNTTVQIVPLKDSGCFGVCLLLIKLRQTDKNKRQPTKRRWGNVKSEEWPSNRVDEIKERERDCIGSFSRLYNINIFRLDHCMFILITSAGGDLSYPPFPARKSKRFVIAVYAGCGIFSG